MTDPDPVTAAIEAEYSKGSNFEKSILLLENDVDALGWDQPARLYAVVGDDDDLLFRHLSTFSDHPVDFLRDQVKNGRLRELLDTGVIKGVAILTEAWRHPYFEEFQEKPEWQVLIQMAKASGLCDTAAEEKAKKAFEFANSRVTPSRNPHRQEMRNVMVVMQDGRIMSALRDRGGEAKITEALAGGRVDLAMTAFLTGVWPEEDI